MVVKTYDTGPAPARTARGGRGATTWSGAAPRSTAPSLPRFRESDFAAVEHHEGISPAWPFAYADLEPFYGAAEEIYRVHGDTRDDPTEDLPSPGNRATVDGHGTITTARRARNTGTHRRFRHRASRLLRDAGYDAIITQHFDISMNSHQRGTVVAGTDPATSVLDPWCHSHEVENLWVLDGGDFPSLTAMNPALTIAAQALRAVAESGLAG